MEGELGELVRKAGQARDPAEGLRALSAIRLRLDELEARHVERAVRAGWAWQRIAKPLGVSRQAVHKKHARRIRAREAFGPAVSAGVRRAVAFARAEARALERSTVCPEHLLLGVLREAGEGVTELGLHGISLDAARRAAAEVSGPAGSGSGDRLEISSEARAAVERGVRTARRLGDEGLEVEHLLAGLLADERGGSVRMLRKLRWDPARVRDALRRRLESAA